MNTNDSIINLTIEGRPPSAHKAEKSHGDTRLEKPFGDRQTMRILIRKQRLSCLYANPGFSRKLIISN